MVVSQLPLLPPESRQPLRERCQVALAIIPISYWDWNRMYDCNCKLVLEFEDDEEEEEEEEEGEKKQKHNQEYHSPSPSLTEESHLVEIMEGLYIALMGDDEDVSALRTFDDKRFTHVVQVSYTTPTGNDPLSLSNWRREEAPRNALVQRLDLVCPAVSLCHRAEQTAVGPEELHAARDFLTLVLPHGSTKWWPEELRKVEQSRRSEQEEQNTQNEQDDDNDDVNVQVVTLAHDYGLDDFLNEQSDRVEDDNEVNVLVVAPTSRAVDVLSVLFCYLAFLEDTTSEDLVEADYCDEVWEQVTLGRWSMCYVDLIARCN